MSTRPRPPIAMAALGAGALAVLASLLAGPFAGLIAAGVAAPLLLAQLRRGAERANAEVPRDLPLVLDVVAALLRGGQPLGAALAAATPLARGPLAGEIARVSGLLQLGATSSAAWASGRLPGWSSVAAAASRSAESGIRLAGSFEALAAELRSEARGRAEVRAARAGVLAIAPLGACFLPAFLCLGVAPVVAGVARDVLGGVT